MAEFKNATQAAGFAGQMSNLLKALVLLYWLVGTLDVAASLLMGDALPAGLRAWLEVRSQAPDLAEWLKRGWMIALLVALIAGSLGILRLQNWGRWCFAGANAAMFASYPLLDAMVYTWFGGLFADLSMVADRRNPAGLLHTGLRRIV